MIRSIHNFIRTNFGKDCLKLTKDFEKNSKENSELS